MMCLNVRPRLETQSTLRYTIHYGNYSMVKSLLEQPMVRVDIKHKHSRTTLHLAVFAGRIEFVHLLRSIGRNPDLQDDSGESPWAWARHFNRPVMRMILSNDPDPDLFLELNHHGTLSYRCIRQ